MKTVCATNMPFVEEAFRTLGATQVLEGRRITAADVRDVDLLAVRSTTTVGRALLDGSRVRFVGTATIGTDHLDLDYLAQAGIAWCFAPGCNANSVSEYITGALLCLAHRHGFSLAGKTLGVIGVGNVGSRVVRKAAALGLRVLQNDPPRARGEPGPAGAIDLAPGPFVDLDEVIETADILTLHVPLTRTGPDRTWHLADERFFSRVKRGCVFIDAARGPVVASDVLLQALASGQVAHAVLDTWEGEPAYRPDVLARVDLATPHIAGHSFEGKVNGTVMVYEAACRFLKTPVAWSAGPLIPPAPVPRLAADARGRSDEAVLWDLVRQVYDIEDDDRRLRATCGLDDARRAAAFDQLRRDYPERREFPCTTVTLTGATPALRGKVAGLGFQLA